MDISILLVRGVLAELRSRGLDERLALAGTSVDDSRLSGAGAGCTVSATEWEQIVFRAVQLTDDPALALAIGEHFPLSALHWLGHLLRSAPTLRDALRLFERYAALLAEPLVWSLQEQGNEARFGCELLLSRGEACRFAVELALGIGLRMGLRLAPRHPKPNVRVHLAFPPPSHATTYEASYGCPVRFRERDNAIVFPRELLDEPRLPEVSPMLEPFREHAERLLVAHAQRALADRTRALLTFEGDLSQFDAPRIAAVLGLPERVLRRRLAEEGTPLAELLSELRRDVAIREMQRPNVAIKALSERLGFSEPSAFHRAFKRWTGKTPSEYMRVEAREQKQGTGAWSNARRIQPCDDARADPSGVFQLHEVADRKQLLNDHA